MAMLGVLWVLNLVVCGSILMVILPVLLGTHLYHKTRFKKTGIAIRCVGYAMPLIAIALLCHLACVLR